MVKVAKEYKGEVSPCGSGNYICEEAKKIARFQRELRDTKDAIKNLYDALCELDVKYMERWKSL